MRLALELDKSVVQRINKIKQRMEVRSDAEVIGRALAIYELLTDVVTKEGQVYYITLEGVVEEVEIK